MENQLTVIPPLADVGSSQATPRHCALLKMMCLLVGWLGNVQKLRDCWPLNTFSMNEKISAKQEELLIATGLAINGQWVSPGYPSGQSIRKLQGISQNSPKWETAVVAFMMTLLIVFPSRPFNLPAEPSDNRNSRAFPLCRGRALPNTSSSHGHIVPQPC